MDGNPYARALEMIRNEYGTSPLLMRRGTVASRSPLSVYVAGMKIPAADLKLDKRLAEALAAELGGGGYKTLTIGSRLLLLTEDDQTYYIVCEVIDA